MVKNAVRLLVQNIERDEKSSAIYHILPQHFLWIANSLVGLITFITSGAPSPLRPSSPPRVQHYSLAASETWRLNAPDNIRFDTSGLLLTHSGQLLAINDKGGGIYRIDFSADRQEATLIPQSDLFPLRELARFATRKHGFYDGEGLAEDSEGRIYFCEESDRWILRCNPTSGAVEQLPIDWAPVQKWFSTDRNASFEGIAVGDGRLYVANERQIGRIIVVDLQTLKVVDSFQAAPIGLVATDIHYSDLSWFDHELWILCRESRCVLRIHPGTHQLLAQYDYASIERAKENVYWSFLPFGFVEGLAVDATNIWLAVDNNGCHRVASPTDTRSTLWRCPRPDRPAP